MSLFRCKLATFQIRFDKIAKSWQKHLPKGPYGSNGAESPMLAPLLQVGQIGAELHRGEEAAIFSREGPSASARPPTSIWRLGTSYLALRLLDSSLPFNRGCRFVDNPDHLLDLCIRG